MIHNLDQTSDINGQQLYRLSRLYPLPPFVKKAGNTEIYGDDEMETHQYANPSCRQFPCHTAAATYISTLFFMDKKAQMDPEQAEFIDARLDEFASIHGVTNSCKQLREKLAANEPRDNEDELPDEDFALVLEADESRSGAKERHYPMRNALEVKRAAEYVQEYVDVLPYSYRQKIACKIIDKANEYGAGLGDLDTFLQKQAGHGAAPSQEIGQFLFDRARLLKRAGHLDYGIRLAKIAKTIIERPIFVHGPEQVVKLAALVDDVDKVTGLNRLISDLPKAEDVFFSITEKTASTLRTEHFVTSSGNFYKRADMNDLKLSDVRSFMGDDFADAISTGGLFVSSEKVASIASTLPSGDADLFDRLLTSVGINPVAKEASHLDESFSSAELGSLAKLHNGA